MPSEQSVSPTPGHRYERDDEVFEVEKVYLAKQHDGRGGFNDVTLVKLMCVEPMPRHVPLDFFAENYAPYDPDAD